MILQSKGTLLTYIINSIINLIKTNNDITKKGLVLFQDSFANGM